MLQLSRKNQFVGNLKKCSFGCRYVEYLGHIISEGGVQMDPSKVTAILKWPIPRIVKGVRGFLGLTGYYRRFIQEYGKIAKPLTKLLKGDRPKSITWTTEAQTAFEELQRAITKARVSTTGFCDALCDRNLCFRKGVGSGNDGRRPPNSIL